MLSPRDTEVLPANTSGSLSVVLDRNDRSRFNDPDVFTSVFMLVQGSFQVLFVIDIIR